jgi:hypothetical protein
MLVVTRRELEKACRLHAKHSDPTDVDARRLALTYAVECGLKAMILKNYNVEASNRLRAAAGFQHDLNEGLEKLGAPLQLRVRRGMTKQTSPQTVAAGQLHEAFRYGVALNSYEVIEDLKTVHKWILARI